MKIDECCEYAKKHEFSHLNFYFTDIKGKVKKCEWLDAYFEIFRVEGMDEGEIITVSQWKETTKDIFEFRLKP